MTILYQGSGMRNFLITFLLFATIALSYYLFLLRNQPIERELLNYYHPPPNLSNVSDAEDPIYILAWTKRHDKRYLDEEFSGCDNAPTAHCLITADRHYLNRSLAVIFHVRDVHLLDLPAIKYRHQKYIFECSEAPPWSWLPLGGVFQTYFDWSLTYRSDSTFYKPYAYFELLNTTKGKTYPKTILSHGPETVPLESLAERRKLIAWVVSDCTTPSKRMLYVRELSKYVPVDVYGKCGSVICEGDCLPLINARYKFYISFENSVCHEYVTEKFGFRLAQNLVPIVLRRSDFVNILPPPLQNSTTTNQSSYYFIAAEDFASPKALADYILYLHANPKEYLKYFEWRSYWRIVSGDHRGYCELCAKLHQRRSRARELHSANKGEDTKTVLNKMSIDDRDDGVVDLNRWWYNDNACDRNFMSKLLSEENHETQWTRWIVYLAITCIFVAIHAIRQCEQILQNSEFLSLKYSRSRQVKNKKSLTRGIYFKSNLKKSS